MARTASSPDAGIPAFDDDQQRTVADHLQATLVELTDLALQGKQAHWNLTGPRFKPLHEHLDELVSSWRIHADTVAERAVAVGVPARGQARDIVEATPLDVLPSGWIRDDDIVEAFIRRVGEVVGAVRQRAEQLGELDPVSEGVLLDVLTDLEEQHWMLRASR